MNGAAVESGRKRQEVVGVGPLEPQTSTQSALAHAGQLRSHKASTLHYENLISRFAVNGLCREHFSQGDELPAYVAPP